MQLVFIISLNPDQFSKPGQCTVYCYVLIKHHKLFSKQGNSNFIPWKVHFASYINYINQTNLQLFFFTQHEMICCNPFVLEIVSILQVIQCGLRLWFSMNIKRQVYGIHTSMCLGHILIPKGISMWVSIIRWCLKALFWWYLWRWFCDNGQANLPKILFWIQPCWRCEDPIWTTSISLCGRKLPMHTDRY